MGSRYDRMGESNGKVVLPNDTVADYIDKYAGRVVVIQDDASKIHYGEHYIHNDIDSDVDTGSPKQWVITTDDGRDFSMTFRVNADDVGKVELFEDPTVSDYGDRVYCFNSNRVIGEDPSDLKLYSNSTVSDDGDRLLVYLIGTSGGLLVETGGETQSFSTLILDTTNKDYMIRFTPDNDNTRVVLSDTFHEYKKEGTGV